MTFESSTWKDTTYDSPQHLTSQFYATCSCIRASPICSSFLGWLVFWKENKITQSWNEVVLGSVRFCLTTISRIKRHPSVWENIHTDDIFDKVLPSKICIKSSRTPTHKKKMNPITKWAEDLNRHFSTEAISGGRQAHEKTFHIANHQRNTH